MYTLGPSQDFVLQVWNERVNAWDTMWDCKTIEGVMAKAHTVLAEPSRQRIGIYTWSTGTFEEITMAGASTNGYTEVPDSAI